MFGIHQAKRPPEYLIFRLNGKGQEFYRSEPDFGIQKWGGRHDATRFSACGATGTLTALIVDNPNHYDYGISPA